MSFEEWKAVSIFVLVLFLWVTKGTFHEIDETIVALIGAILALLPTVGVVKWNDVDIPWHLMLFSAGAYTLGSGLSATDLPNPMVNAALNSLGFGTETPYWVLYLLFTGIMMFSALVFQSKNVRVMVFTNQDEVELLVNGVSLGRKPVERFGHAEWDAVFSPGSGG